MAFEYHNAQPRQLDLTIRNPSCVIRVPANSFLPSPNQEQAGITAEVLKDFVSPGWLQPTAPAVRRKLLEEAQLSVDKNTLAATSHLAEFRRGAKSGSQKKDQIETSQVTPTPTSNDDALESLNKTLDRLSSSGSGKK